MLDSKLASLLTSLSETEYVTSKQLAEKSEISDRTVQTRIRDLREELERHGATITARQRYGYLLAVNDREQYEAWLAGERNRLKTALPNSVEERFRYLLKLFLESSEYFKLEELSEQLCISSKTLSTELKQVEFVLGQYDLTMQRKPHYGVRVQGSEFDKRKCCMDYLGHVYCGGSGEEGSQPGLASLIGEVLLDIMLRQRVNFSEAAFQNLVLYLCIAYLRNRAGYGITQEPDPERFARVQKMPEYAIAQMLVRQLREVEVEIQETPAELMYIAVYIAGRRILGDEYKLQSNPVVLENVNYLSTLLLNCIQKVYNLNFRDNLNVRISLYNHLATFHIRMMYGIPCRTPSWTRSSRTIPLRSQWRSALWRSLRSSTAAPSRRTRPATLPSFWRWRWNPSRRTSKRKTSCWSA